MVEMTLLTDGGSVVADRGAVMCAAPSSVPLIVNAAIRVCPDASAEHVLDAAERFFAGKSRGFTMYVHDTDTDLASTARERGLMQIVERYPQMVCHHAPPERPGAERVSDPAAAASYWDICRSAYPSLGVDAAAFTGFQDALLLEPHIGAFLVTDKDGTPAACAMATLGHGIATVCWVACEPRRRGRGLAATATTTATRWAFDHGAAAVSLQASSMGEALYHALGYEDLTNYKLFLKPPPAPTSELPWCDQRSSDAHRTSRR
jgi:GNAT superfamily N-acetyltransferase